MSSYPFVDKELMRNERLHVIDCLRLIKCFRVREIDEVTLICVVNSLRNAAEGGVEWWGLFSEGRIRASAGNCLQCPQLPPFPMSESTPSIPLRQSKRQPEASDPAISAPIVAARVLAAEREQFYARAAASNKKPGTLLRELIQAHISEAGQEIDRASQAPRIRHSGDPELERLEFRLPKFLKEEVKKRAELEGMKSAQWVSSLVQSSLMTTPVLTDQEVEVVSWANRELAAVGRNLNQIARSMNRAELIGESFSKDEVLTLEGINQVNASVRKLRDMMLRLVAARHRAWGVVDDSTT